MKRYLQIAALILACTFFINLPDSAKAAVVDKIVVVVNSEIITQREIDIMLSPVYAQYRTMYKGEELIRRLEEVREGIIKQLIEDRLIFSEAKKANITVEEKEINVRIEEIQRKIGSEKELEDMLNQQNLTLNELRARYKEKIMIRKLIDQKVGARIIITPLEVKNYYSENKDQFLQSEEIQLRQILIKPKQQDKASQDEALRITREIVKRIQDGCDFAGLAKEYSSGPATESGGLMGYVKKGDLMPQIEEIAFNLKDGETSGIIQTPLGYHLFKVEQRKFRRTKELSEVRQEIEEYLYRQKADQRLRGWIDSLAKNAYIEFK
ncbi:MAG: peptidylprolyl isomerase [Candidatus Omnitrophota bacterium]|nr:peptidylprolyl isomerase [Candidatus Omnitrophota bacterium]